MNKQANFLLRLAVLGAMAATLSGCAALARLSEIGSEPSFSPIADVALEASDQPNDSSHIALTERQGGVDGTVSNQQPEIISPVAIAHLNAAGEPYQSKNSLWGGNTRSLYDDQRAKQRGDIVTILVDVSDSAKFDNSTSGSRLNSEDFGLNNLLGYGKALEDALPDGAIKESLVDVNTSNSTASVGAIDRSETLQIKVAATVVRVLPNGNLLVHGRQEIRVNAELRELVVSGIVRPADVTSENTVSSAKIAEARIGYGGRGYLQNLQQPRYGQQLLDILMPF